jgi:3-deoxy-7-phosphoheptulonate synthase
MKVGPSMETEELARVLDILNPDRESGRSYPDHSVWCRQGKSDAMRDIPLAHPSVKIEKHLASHIKAVKQSGHTVVWVCDPMHGKYVGTAIGAKTFF